MRGGLRLPLFSCLQYLTHMGIILAMTKTELEAIEELHQYGTAIYFSEDGSREVEVDVCLHCEEHAGLKYAAAWPCEPIQEAEEKAEMAYAVEKGADCDYVLKANGQSTGICLACQTEQAICKEPSVHEFLHVTGVRAMKLLK